MEQEFHGVGGWIIVDPVKVTLKFRKSFGDGRNSTEIYLRSISAIEIREPKMFAEGFIEFIYAGNHPTPGGSAKSENKIVLATGSQYREMLKAKYLIERYIANPNFQEQNHATAEPVPHSTLSVLEEIKKAAELRDAGVLSNEEFEDFKKRLLS
ncbi:hypothetical protein D7Z26_24560 [Cohnella endophytica]|uniref:SHOCT domain-containing protein n=1 Tax=Cohnella endophytica TaxID=2419778 RepID=A0A494X8A0_9BACL|nr:SHOCT domain-containing protein [Cohnella endophytica]RKP46778.1 hypothetical protein D7Z26_24560 [Cohnella endophytica]